MICIECGGTAYNNTELCENCMEMSRTGMSMDMARQCDMSSMSCATCRRMITADSRTCTNCRKSYHLSCDSSDASTLEGFVCNGCRRRLPDDVMLSSSMNSRGVNDPLSPFSDPTVAQIALQMPSAPMTWPSQTDFGVDAFAQMSGTTAAQQNQLHMQQILAQQSQIMDEISDGGATNDSDRNSSPFFQESSDYDEDFVPVSTRGRGRGGAKKKPGRGQSTGIRRQTNPPPSGYFSATQIQASALGFNPQTIGAMLQNPPTTRGKRGKRGAPGSGSSRRETGKGPGRGRGRGRGNAAQAAAVLQQVQYGSSASSSPMGLSMMFQSSSTSQMLQMGAAPPPSNPAAPPMAPTLPPPSVLPDTSVSAPAPPAPVAPTLPDPLLPTTVPNFQPTPQPVAVREVDESMLEDETSRQSGGSRSDEVEYVRTAVVCRIDDEFLRKACMCLVCGSVGKGLEGSMIACSNCAQTYHTYCVNLQDKLNSAVMTRGWRCLDCTVCEGCGTGGDESKLLLCDECDVSYHIYHMKPPLERIPQGPYRCQWCSRCRRCNHKVTSGSELNSAGICHPCASLHKCPRCEKIYQLTDKIIRCSQCSKWQHGHCEGLYTDEQLEQAATNRMRCSACRPNRSNAGFSDGETVVVCDNVALNKNSDEILKSKYTPSALRNHMMETYGRESFDHYDEDYTPDDSSDAVMPQPSVRGRGRGNPGGRRGSNRVGVGGFFVRLSRHRQIALAEEAAAQAAAAAAADDEDTKKLKRPRKPRRSQLEDAYPAQIQEAFFGMKAIEGKALVDVAVEEPILAEHVRQTKREPMLKAHELSTDATEMLRNDINENEFLENMDFGNIDTDIDIDNLDFSLFDDEYDEELEDSLQGGDMDSKDGIAAGPTTFNLDQPSTSSSSSTAPSGFPDGFRNQMPNAAQQAPGIRAANTLSRSGSQSTDAPERYQFAERWEEDEPLGLGATTAAVLYANEKHGYLKDQFKEWSDRVKQIQKLWRNLSSEDRQEYVNRARENRTLRGRMPRPRRVNVHSTNSVDSPTVQSPAPHQFGFKVPVNPGDLSSSGIGAPGLPEDPNLPPPQKQVRITCHLPPDVYQQYQELKRVQSDRENLTAQNEKTLGTCRKQKKNLSAKKRQMIKTAQSTPGFDGREVEMKDEDKAAMDTLPDRIKALQTEVENSKRELKMHEGLVREFEQRHNILRLESEVNQQMIDQSNMRNQQYMAQAEQMRAQQAPPPSQVHPLGQGPPQVIPHPAPQQRMFGMPMLRPPPPGGHPGGLPGPGPQVPQVHQQGHPQGHPQGLQPGHPQGHPQGLPQGIPPGHPGHPGAQRHPGQHPQQHIMIRHGHQLTPQQQQEMHHRHMLILQHRARRTRSIELAGIRFDQITDPVLKDVYEFLDDLVGDISFHADNPGLIQQQQALQMQLQQQGHPGHPGQGPPGAMGLVPQPQMLKRVLHPGGGPQPMLIMPGHLPPGQGPPQQGGPHQIPPQVLQQPGGSQQPPTPMSAQPQPQLLDDGPKPKKKRNNPKKTTTTYPVGGEFDAWIEKMRTRFRLCPDIPKRQREPSLARKGCEFVSHGMSNMAVGPSRRPLVGDFGMMGVKRGTQFFGNDERNHSVLNFQEVSLYQVEPYIRTGSLHNNRGPPTAQEGEILQDDDDRQPAYNNPNSYVQMLLNKKRAHLDHIRCNSRYNDEAKAPLNPDLECFYEELEPEEEVTVELVFNTEYLTPESSVDEKKELVVKLNDHLKGLLKIKQEIPWNLEDTPPDSPAPSSPEPDASELIRSSTSRAPSTSVEKEIKREVEEEAGPAPLFREIKRETLEASCTNFKCKHCQKNVEDASTAVRMKADKLGILPMEAPTEEKEEMVYFCTRKCYYELMATSRVALSHDELAAAEQHVDDDTHNRLKQIHSDSIVRAVNQGKSKLPCAPSTSSLLGNPDMLISPRDTRYMMDEGGKKENVAVVAVSSLIGAVEAPKEVVTQRSTAEDWKMYTQDVFDSFRAIRHQHISYLYSPKMGVPLPPHDLDKRLCVFCGGVGDGDVGKCGRLISLTEFYWVHVNCALWSSEVFEHANGSLVHVDRAVLRAAQTLCEHCKQPGASVKCHKLNCGTNYHLLCALQNNGLFRQDRTYICKNHDLPIQPTPALDSLRKLYVQRDENSMLMRLFDLSEGSRLCLRLGAFTFYKLGSILPKQLKRFHTKDFIFPNQYRATRLFWSPKNLKERMMFECTIEDRNNQPIFVVRSLDDPAICSRGVSATKAWQPIYDRIHQLREQHQGETLKFFGSQIHGETLFGLNENAITKITESLPGFDTIFTYQHRHQNSPVLELPLAENPMGCARAEPRNRSIGQHFRTRPQPMGGTSHHPHGILGSSSGQSSQASVVSTSQEQLQTRQAATSLTSANSGRTRGIRNYYTEEAAARARAFGISPDLANLALRCEPMQSTQTTFSAYQKMRREWKERVYLARSRIAGLGLYAKHDISMGEMIIEYKGEVIRSEVCEVREVRYTSQNRGVYMFRIDEEWVIDATMAGGPARYINHSCDPNCSTQIMDAGSGPREKKIIITANRPISTGEELTYDYQFELEDSTDKIPCLCGAPNCVKWMN